MKNYIIIEQKMCGSKVARELGKRGSNLAGPNMHCAELAFEVLPALPVVGELAFLVYVSPVLKLVHL